MNPIYRITVDHDPTQPEYLKFTGKVIRVSDDAYMSGSTRCAETAGEALDQCREWIAALADKAATLTVYTDEEGNITGPVDLTLIREYAPDTEPYPVA